MIMHAHSVKSLPQEDYVQIEKEHTRLREVLSELKGTCCNIQNQLGCEGCSQEKHAACIGQLNSFFYNLVNLAFNHFSHEELIMLKRPHVTTEYEYFRNHKQAHQTILLDLDRVARSLVTAGTGRVKAFRPSFNRSRSVRTSRSPSATCSTCTRYAAGSGTSRRAPTRRSAASSPGSPQR